MIDIIFFSLGFLALQILLHFHTRRLLVLALDDILLSAFYHFGKLLSGLLVVLEEVVLHQTLGRLAHPLEEREVLEFVCRITGQQVMKNRNTQDRILPARKISRTSKGSSSLRFSMKWPMFRGTIPTSPAM